MVIIKQNQAGTGPNLGNMYSPGAKYTVDSNRYSSKIHRVFAPRSGGNVRDLLGNPNEVFNGRSFLPTTNWHNVNERSEDPHLQGRRYEWAHWGNSEWGEGGVGTPTPFYYIVLRHPPRIIREAEANLRVIDEGLAANGRSPRRLVAYLLDTDHNIQNLGASSDGGHTDSMLRGFKNYYTNALAKNVYPPTL